MNANSISLEEHIQMDNADIAIVFPGQGSQEKAMGRSLAEADADCMDLWKAAEKASGFPLREIYWTGDEKDMAETRYLQPALTVVGMSVWLRLATRIRPKALAGHSLGEFPALAAAGVLRPAEVLELVSLRGRLMAESGVGKDGRMAAVLKLDQAAVEDIVSRAGAETGKELRIANYNSPAQYVISGEGQAVDHALAQVKERKGRGVVLAVSGAFHSPMMAEAADEFAKFMGRYDWLDAKTPVYLNVTGAVETSGELIRRRVRDQMTSSVLWVQSVQAMWNDGARRFIELGPKGVLTRLITAILPGRPELSAISAPCPEAVSAIA